MHPFQKFPRPTIWWFIASSAARPNTSIHIPKLQLHKMYCNIMTTLYLYMTGHTHLDDSALRRPLRPSFLVHYGDVIMGAIAYQITSLTIVYPAVYLDVDQRKYISKLCVTGLCMGNSPGTGEFPAQMASNAENVSIWWRHHEHSLPLIKTWVKFCTQGCHNFSGGSAKSSLTLNQSSTKYKNTYCAGLCGCSI